jgi:2-keto-4-pentenoate hydratase/2-oxohepta-3-ene-1,7-dioic acid hydratase in catechol pathway
MIFIFRNFQNDIHYELEVVVKISKGGKYIQKETAHKHYEEIGLGIDFTARDLQSELKSKVFHGNWPKVLTVLL